MILVDTGPLVALFDPKDPDHFHCKKIIKGIGQISLVTTLAVLDEAFHMLQPDSKGSQQLINFIVGGYMEIDYIDDAVLHRAFELMDQYADRPMDFADATIIAIAENRKTKDVFTIDRNDFQTYRIKIGHRHHPVNIIQ